MKKYAVIFALTMFSQFVDAAIVNVYFAGGQSNMVPNVANAIQATIREEQPNAVVVRQNWSGDSIYFWSVSGARQENYLADLEALQNAMGAISAAGDTPVFSGVFWFQGESDTRSTAAVYKSRFLDMINFYSEDMEMTMPVNYCLALIDCNPLDQYYTPTIGAGVPVIRGAQIELGNMPNGSYFDSSGYERLDLWHLKDQGQTAVGAGMGQAFADKFIPENNSLVFVLVSSFLSLRRRRAAFISPRE